MSENDKNKEELDYTKKYRETFKPSARGGTSGSETKSESKSSGTVVEKKYVEKEKINKQRRKRKKKKGNIILRIIGGLLKFALICTILAALGIGG